MTGRFYMKVSSIWVAIEVILFDCELLIDFPTADTVSNGILFSSPITVFMLDIRGDDSEHEVPTSYCQHRFCCSTGWICLPIWVRSADNFYR
jgi:hypothetical protein